MDGWGLETGNKKAAGWLPVIGWLGPPPLLHMGVGASCFDEKPCSDARTQTPTLTVDSVTRIEAGAGRRGPCPQHVEGGRGHARQQPWQPPQKKPIAS